MLPHSLSLPLLQPPWLMLRAAPAIYWAPPQFAPLQPSLPLRPEALSLLLLLLPLLALALVLLLPLFLLLLLLLLVPMLLTHLLECLVTGSPLARRWMMV